MTTINKYRRTYTEVLWFLDHAEKELRENNVDFNTIICFNQSLDSYRIVIQIYDNR
jgi:hypothetical protein